MGQSIPLMTRDEYQQVIDQTNQASMEIAMRTDFTIADALEQLAAEQPHKTFLIYNDIPISYAEVSSQANDFARLALQRGISQGDAVALMMENRPQFFYAWFGMLKIGACTALINTQARGKTVAHALDSVNCKLAFVGSECAARYVSDGDLPASVPTIEVPDIDETNQTLKIPTASGFGAALAQSGATVYSAQARQGLKNSATACYMFTSGTTGLPKAAFITHSKWLSTGYRWLAMTGLNEQDVFYCVIPVFHGAGLMSLFSVVMALGAPCVLKRRFSAGDFWRDVKQHGITSFVYVGEICRYLTNRPPVAEEENHSLRIIMGAGMGIDVWTPFVERFGNHIHIYEGWGSTESNCSLSNLDNRPGSCGRIPYWDKTFMRLVRYDVDSDQHILDEHGFCLQADEGEAGELLGQVHSGDGTPVSPFDGYTDAAASDKKLLRNVFEAGDCWFRTGDLLRQDPEGYLYFVDRIGDTFRWKSENVSTTEVIQQLSAYGDAEIINVYGVAVPAHEGRAGMAAVIMKTGIDFDPEVFYQLATGALAPFAVPLFVRVGGEMDVTGTFKLRKVDLQKAGYDPASIEGQLYVVDHQQARYSPYRVELLEQLGIARFSA